jgi:hypothetical protein
MAGTVVLQHQSTLQAQALSDNSLTLAVEPSVYHAKAVNETFSIDIKVYNVVDTMQFVGFDFKLRYDPTLIQFISGKNGTFFDPFSASPNGGTMFFGPYALKDTYTPEPYYVEAGGLILADSNAVWHAPFPSGNGTLYTLIFKAISEPTSTVPNAGACDLVLYPTTLADTKANKLPHNDVNGHYDIGPFFDIEPPLYHATALNETFSIDITISNVIAAKQAVGFQFRLYYNKVLLNIVSVKNGSFFDPFAGQFPAGGTLYFGPIYGKDAGGDYVLYAGILLPDSMAQWHAPFPSGNGTLATITFNVISLSGASNLTFSATYLADINANLLPHNYWPMRGYADMVLPILIGDLNGDKTVDIFDAIIWATAINTKPGDARWNALADFNHDNVVDMLDAIMLANHFGQTI